jgi:hypothetical protein
MEKFRTDDYIRQEVGYYLYIGKEEKTCIGL